MCYAVMKGLIWYKWLTCWVTWWYFTVVAPGTPWHLDGTRWYSRWMKFYLKINNINANNNNIQYYNNNNKEGRIIVVYGCNRWSLASEMRLSWSVHRLPARTPRGPLTTVQRSTANLSQCWSSHTNCPDLCLKCIGSYNTVPKCTWAYTIVIRHIKLCYGI